METRPETSSALWPAPFARDPGGRARPAARVQVADEPGTRARRAVRRALRRAPRAALARHRADGRGAVDARFHRDHRRGRLARLPEPAARRDGGLWSRRDRDAVRAARRRARQGRGRLRRRPPRTHPTHVGRAGRPTRARGAGSTTEVAAPCRSPSPAPVGSAAGRWSSTPRPRASSSPPCCSPGAAYDEGVDVRHEGPPVPSQPHIEMTVAALREHGVEVETAPDRWTVAPDADPGDGRDHRARPVQRRAVPDARDDQPGPGDRPGLAARDPSGRRCVARDPDRDGSPRRARRRRAHRDRWRDDRRASTPTCTTSASWRRPSPPCARSRPRRHVCAASRTSAATRPTGSPPWPSSSAVSGRRSTSTTTD